jgi:hypothetical protein
MRYKIKLEWDIDPLDKLIRRRQPDAAKLRIDRLLLC